MREILKNTNCCNTLEIICPCSKEELGQIIYFLRHGKIECVDENDFSKVLGNLNKIMGFPADFDVSVNFSFEDPKIRSAITDYENEPIEIISDDGIFIVSTTNTKQETLDAEFQAG